MAGQKKSFFYEFREGTIEIPATFYATCTVSGEKVAIYHRTLVPLIENKYKNSYKLFIDTYVSPNAKKKQEEEIESDPYHVNTYGVFLAYEYRDAKIKGDTYTMEVCSDRFMKHFKKDIRDYILGENSEQHKC